MSQHETVFTTEKPLPVAEAAPGVELPRELLVPAPQVPAVAVAVETPKISRRRWLRNMLLAGAAVAALAGAADYGWQYWTVGRFEVSTDDAYVKADNTTIAPKVSGYVAAVLVDDNEPVKAGQVLARIDDRDFKVASRAGSGRGRGRQGQHRQQAGGDRRPAVGDRGGAGHRRARPGQRDLRRAGRPALCRAGHAGLWQRPERAAGGLADRRGARHRGARQRGRSPPRPSRSTCSRPSLRRRGRRLSRAMRSRTRPS